MDLEWLSSQNPNNWTEFEIMSDRPNFEAIPQKFHIYLIMLYSLTAIFALVGNLVTLFVLKNNKKTSKNLSKYLINLSISDILMASFSIPFTYTMFMYGQWFFEPRFCPFVLSAQFYSVFVSVYTLVAIGIDRHIAIKTPIRSKTMANHFTNIIIASIWIVGFILSCVPFNLSEATKLDVGNQTIYVCRELLEENEAKIFVVLIFAITFLLPVSIIIYVYSSMAVVIFQRNLTNSASSFLKVQKRKIIKIIMVVVEAFILCWFPLQIFNLITVLFPQTRTFNEEAELNRYVITYFAFHWFAMAHSFVNPIIYSFMSQGFRKEFKNLFCKKVGLSRKFHSSTRNSKSTTTQLDSSIQY